MKTQNNSTTKIASTIHYLPIMLQYRYIKMLLSYIMKHGYDLFGFSKLLKMPVISLALPQHQHWEKAPEDHSHKVPPSSSSVHWKLLWRLWLD